jgi:hypothetical protein
MKRNSFIFYQIISYFLSKVLVVIVLISLVLRVLRLFVPHPLKVLNPALQLVFIGDPPSDPFTSHNTLKTPPHQKFPIATPPTRSSGNPFTLH